MKQLPQPYKYKSFISYSRAADTQLAPALKAALQGFAKAWYKLRAVQVFCDQTNLTANPDLWASIEKHLAASEYFIYLASPQAAQSKWVRKEISFFHDTTGVDKMIIVLTDGDIVWDDAANDFNWQLTTAVPKLDEVLFTQEPVWIDMRWIRKDQLSARDPRFLDAVANLSSVLRNIDKDTLIGKDVEEHRKARRFRLFSLVGLSLLAVFLTIATWLAIRSQNLSQERLVKTFTSNGIALLKSGDYARALPWFVEALGDEKNDDKKEMETYRIENLMNQAPALWNVWQSQLPVMKTAFLSNHTIMILSGHSENWWTNEYDCNGDCPAKLRVLNTETGNEVYPPIELKDGVRESVISRDKTLFASLSLQNVLQLWNLGNGKLLWQQHVDIPVTRDAFHCGFDMSADNSRLLFYYENKIVVYETTGGALVNHFTGTDATLQEAKFLPGRDAILFVSDKLYSWQPNGTKASVVQLPFLQSVLSFVLSPDDRHIAIAGSKPVTNAEGNGYTGSEVVAYANLDNLQQPLFVKPIDNTTNGFKLAFDEHTHALATNSSYTSEVGSHDDGTRVWDVPNGDPVSDWIRLPQEVAVSFDSAGSKLVITCGDGTTEIWSLTNPTKLGASKRLWLLHDGSQEVKSIFSPDNQYLLTCGLDNLVKLWKIPADDFVPLHLYNNLTENDDAGTYDSSYTFTTWYRHMADEDAKTDDSSLVFIYNVKTKQRTGKPLHHNSEVYLADISPDENYVATVALKEACMWNRNTQQKLYTFSFGNTAAPKDIFFTKDSKRILVVFTDYTAGVWDVKTGRMVTGYLQHPNAASFTDEGTAKFSDDDKKIITSDNASYCIWDAVSGEPLCAPVELSLPTGDDSLDSITNHNRRAISKANTLLIQPLSLQDIRTYTALLAGGELDANSNFAPLTANDFMKRWEVWKRVAHRPVAVRH